MFKELNPLLHSELRLAVVSILIGVESADFVFIRQQTGATAGNLSVQLDKLAKAGYIEVEKTFRGKIPCTVCRITDAGRDAQEYCLAFQLVEGVRARQRLIESGVQIDQLEDEADWRSAAISPVWPEMVHFEWRVSWAPGPPSTPSSPPSGKNLGSRLSAQGEGGFIRLSIPACYPTLATRRAGALRRGTSCSRRFF